VNIKNILESPQKRAPGQQNCNTLKDSNPDVFKLLCKTFEDDSDIDTDSDDADGNGNKLPDELKCEDKKVKYKSLKKYKLGRKNNIESSELCKNECESTKDCFYWTWKKNRKVCVLRSGVITTGFRRKNRNSVSGTMLNGCKEKEPQRTATRSGASCVDPRGLTGTCSFITDPQCSEVLGAINTLGPTWEVLRFLQLAARSPCGFNFQRFDYAICCVPNDPPPPTPQPGCGFSPGKRWLAPKVVGGTESNTGTWPWAAILGVKSGDDGISVLCGGTLIKKDYVLTAAHCFHGSTKPDLIRLGDTDISETSDGTHEDFTIGEYIEHPDYESGSEKNDIALIKLSSSVTFRNGLSPACLPDQFKGVSLDDLTKRPAIIGWGSTAGFQSTVEHLREAYVPLVKNPTCKDKYAALGRDISSKQICAGDETYDSCGGDSGGPMLSSEKNNGRWAVIGITSFGPSICAHSQYPGVYTRVTEYLDWIESKTGGAGGRSVVNRKVG